VLAGIEAYNNFLFDEFCAPDPKRLVGMAQIPSIGIDSAVDGLRKAKARGAKGGADLELAGGQRELVERRRSVLGRRSRRRSAGHHPHQHHQPEPAPGGRKAAAARGSQLYDMSTEATRAKAIGGMSHVFSMATGCMTDMIFTGVFERFPRPQSVLDREPVSAGSRTSRVPRRPLVAQPRVGRPAAHEPPSFYWYRNNAASFIIDHTGVELRNRVGIDNMMWSSDYPHHGNDWPYSRRTIEEMMAASPRTSGRVLPAANAERLWNLDV